jgi:hypothetical protein
MGTSERASEPGTFTRVEFTLSNGEYPFVGITTIDGCRAALEKILPRSVGTYAEFFEVSGVEPARALEAARAHESAEPTLLDEYESGGLFEFRVSRNCPVVFLCERGALARDVYGADGRGRISAEIPPWKDASGIVDAFLDSHPDAELRAKREQASVTPLIGHRQYKRVLSERLTDRQREVFTAAYEAGYYEWPREITAETLATDLDVSTSTLLDHLRSVEQTFVRLFFEPTDR